MARWKVDWEQVGRFLKGEKLDKWYITFDDIGRWNKQKLDDFLVNINLHTDEGYMLQLFPLCFKKYLETKDEITREVMEHDCYISILCSLHCLSSFRALSVRTVDKDKLAENEVSKFVEAVYCNVPKVVYNTAKRMISSSLKIKAERALGHYDLDLDKYLSKDEIRRLVMIGMQNLSYDCNY